jgi:hypothetical protein
VGYLTLAAFAKPIRNWLYARASTALGSLLVEINKPIFEKENMRKDVYSK